MLEGNYENDNGDLENIYCGMKRGTKKHFKRNKKEYKRLSQHIGLIPLVFVSPSDVSLIEGGSDERRKLMDVVISQYDNTYIEALSNYNKALQQRNALLKMEAEPDVTLMELWEQQMAMNGELLFAKRQAFVNELIPLFQQIYQHISGDKEQVCIIFRTAKGDRYWRLSSVIDSRIVPLVIRFMEFIVTTWSLRLVTIR